MKRLCTLLPVLVLLVPLSARELLYNSDLSKVMKTMPKGWYSMQAEAVTLEKGAAPGGKNAVTVKGKSAMVRQNGLRLVAGEEYELSAMIRISGPDFLIGRVYVINAGWDDAQGPDAAKVPRDGKWHKISRKFKLVKSSGDYGAVLWLSAKGNTSVSIADVVFRPVNPAIADQCENALSVSLRDVIPVTPLLFRIPEEKPVLRVMLGRDEKAPFFCLCKVDDGPVKKAAFRNDFAELDLKGIQPGRHTLTLQLADGKGKVLSGSTYPIRVLKKAPVDTSAHRRLNNLTVSLLETQVRGKSLLTFSNPREGWVFFSFPDGSKVTLNGKNVRFSRFVRCLPKGTFSVAVEGKGAASIRAIPEIVSDPVFNDNYIPNAGVFDIHFIRKYIFPGVTTFNGSRFLPEHLQEFHDRGAVFIHNVDRITRLIATRNEAKLLARMAECDKKHQACTSGGTPDELYWSNPGSMRWFGQFISKHPVPENWIFSPWCAGDIPVTPVLTDALSLILNRTPTRSMLYHEAYCVQQRTPEQAEKYLDRMLVQNSRNLKENLPSAWERFGLVLGTFNQIPLISVEIYPDCDYKYFLDMQFRILANHPDLKDLGCIGCWATYYGDEEMTRWFFRLVRHYAIEGKTEMLSPKYGFTFKAEYLKNTDFEDGLKEWTVSGDVKQTNIPKLGKYEQRWNCGASVGNTCALLKGGSSVRQTAKGLVPGRLYRIKYATAPYDVVKKGDQKAPIRDDGIRLRISGVTEVPEKRYDGGKLLGRNAAVQIHRRVFKANGTTAEFEFRNEKSGAESVMNFVQLTPYYPDEDLAEKR